MTKNIFESFVSFVRYKNMYFYDLKIALLQTTVRNFKGQQNFFFFSNILPPVQCSKNNKTVLKISSHSHRLISRKRFTVTAEINGLSGFGITKKS